MKTSPLENAIDNLTITDDEMDLRRDRFNSAVWYDHSYKKNRACRNKYYQLELLPDDTQKEILEQNFDGYSFIHDYYTQELQKFNAHTGRLYEEYGSVTSELLHKDARGKNKEFLKRNYSRDYERTSVYCAIKNAYHEWTKDEPELYKLSIDDRKRAPSFIIKNNGEYSRIVIHKNQIRLSRNLGHFKYRSFNKPEDILGVIHYAIVYRDLYNNRYFVKLLMVSPDDIRNRTYASRKSMPETLAGVIHDCDMKAKLYSDRVKVRMLAPNPEPIIYILMIPGETGLYIIHSNDVIDTLPYPKHAIKGLRRFRRIRAQMDLGKSETEKQNMTEQLKFAERTINGSLHNSAHHLSCTYMYEATRIVFWSASAEIIDRFPNPHTSDHMYQKLYELYQRELVTAFQSQEGNASGKFVLIPSDQITLERLTCPTCGHVIKQNKYIHLYRSCPKCNTVCNLMDAIRAQIDNYLLTHSG